MTTEELLHSSELSSLGAVRAGEAADAIDGAIPRLVIEPDTAEHLAAALAWASRARLHTVIRGAGTKRDWGRIPPSLDLVVGTSRLKRLIVHRHGDLTATFDAGARLKALQPELARERQWLPIDAAFDEATIGGIVATNDAGPLRHRHGTPRDLLIGVTLALTDGRLVKAGGHVVKNVAGYDLGKLVSGSYGGLAAIVDATFKLAPIPAASRTVVARYADAGALARDVVILASSQLEATAFDLRVSLAASAEYSLHVRFATSPAAVDAQVTSAAALLGGRVETVAGGEEIALWDDQVRRPWMERGAVIRLSWLPAALPAVLALVGELQHFCARPMELTARATVGVGLLRIDADDADQDAVIAGFRARPDVVGHVVVLRASVAVKTRVDVWGPSSDMGGILRSLKDTFDPAGILNAGRGPI
jgi:glycolate oxidase FAD binding subunit